MHDMLRPMESEIVSVVEEAPGLRTFVLRPERPMDWKPGQFVLVSRPGSGESAFAISSSPNEKGTISISVQSLGKNTSALHEMDSGEWVGLRGPYGNSFPIETWKGKNILLAGGGIGLAPLRPVVYSILSDRGSFGSVTLVCGAREPDLLPYKQEIASWADSIELVRTVDKECSGWECEVGVVPKVMEATGFRPDNSVAVTCGPPIMIHYAVDALRRMGFPDDSIFTTLEMKMKCGVGICGRCNIDHRYICKDGPVFSLDQLQGVEL